MEAAKRRIQVLFLFGQPKGQGLGALSKKNRAPGEEGAAAIPEVD
jgi:hypothetical protein